MAAPLKKELEQRPEIGRTSLLKTVQQSSTVDGVVCGGREVR